MSTLEVLDRKLYLSLCHIKLGSTFRDEFVYLDIWHQASTALSRGADSLPKARQADR